MLKGEFLVMPKALREKVLSLAHSGHQGGKKAKLLLQSKVWWPDISQDVKWFVAECPACQAAEPLGGEKPTPLRPSVLPAKPWEVIGIDVFGTLPSGQSLLVLADNYYRFPEVEIMASTTSKAIAEKL